MHFRILVGILLGIWLLLVLLGKGGFVYLLLLTAIGIGVVDLVSVYRGRVMQDNALDD